MFLKNITHLLKQIISSETVDYLQRYALIISRSFFSKLNSMSETARIGKEFHTTNYTEYKYR